MVYLEVGVEPIRGEVVIADGFAGVEDDLGRELVYGDSVGQSWVSYCIDLSLALQLLCNLICPFKTFKVALDPMNLAGIAVILKLFHCLLRVLFFLRD